MHERRHSFIDVLVVFAGLGFAMALLSALSGAGWIVFTNPTGWLRQLDPGTSFDILSNAAEVVAGVLGIAITVVAIVLELAANRYSHRITWIFIRDPVNICVLSWFILTTLQCVWVSATLSSEANGGEEGRIAVAGMAITLGMVTISLLALLPYFNYVFAFLSPLNMIDKIKRGALGKVRSLQMGKVEETQAEVEESVDELLDIARSATEQGDRSIAMATVNAMAELLEGYHPLRPTLPNTWFRIAPSVASDPDFVALAPSAIAEIEENKLWLEVKVMLQYLSLVRHCVPNQQDVANLIAINTQRLARGPGRTDPALCDLCLRCMNSYLRTAINAQDPRTAYYILNQYRLIAESLLDERKDDDVLRIAGYMQFYGVLGYERSLPFLLETVAHDVTELIEADLDRNGTLTDRLLDLLLELDRETRKEGQEQALLGVRRSQMKLATLFLELGQDARARRIAEDLSSETHARLDQVESLLEETTEPQYWEFTARGIDFAYLPETRRAHLQKLTEMIGEARRATHT